MLTTAQRSSRELVTPVLEIWRRRGSDDEVEMMMIFLFDKMKSIGFDDDFLHGRLRPFLTHTAKKFWNYSAPIHISTSFFSSMGFRWQLFEKTSVIFSSVLLLLACILLFFWVYPQLFPSPLHSNEVQTNSSTPDQITANRATVVHRALFIVTHLYSSPNYHSKVGCSTSSDPSTWNFSLENHLDTLYSSSKTAVHVLSSRCVNQPPPTNFSKPSQNASTISISRDLSRQPSSSNSLPPTISLSLQTIQLSPR